MTFLETINKNSDILALLLVSCSLKLLLFPAYFSTDFQVHQNWLRITHQHSLNQWYYNTQSKWTLDYPPLFAYFEYFLSIIAHAINPIIVTTINKQTITIIFQRLSVIATDVLYLWSLIYAISKNGRITTRLSVLYLWIPFIMLDNIHFQYNIMMQAILIFSVGFMNRKKYLHAAFTFSILLNFKHIYMYCAPAYFIYLIKYYILKNNTTKSLDKKTITQVNYYQHQSQQDEIDQPTDTNQSWLLRLIKLSMITIIPFIISFGPFLLIGGIEQLKQICSRLFPISRGLVHQNWAPNFWAIYYFVDKVLAIVGFSSPTLYKISQSNNNILKVLPNISVQYTIIIIVITLIPIIIVFFISKKKIQFTSLVCISGLLFFLFGFHVHQKAITPYINLLFVFVPWTTYLNAAVFVNIVNLVLLLHQPRQRILNIVVCLLWISIWQFLDQQRNQQLFKAQQNFVFNLCLKHVKQLIVVSGEYFIQIIGILVIVFHYVIYPLKISPNFEFLPLMINSVLCAIFNILWIFYLYYRIIDEQYNKTQPTDKKKYLRRIQYKKINYNK